MSTKEEEEDGGRGIMVYGVENRVNTRHARVFGHIYAYLGISTLIWARKRVFGHIYIHVFEHTYAHLGICTLTRKSPWRRAKCATTAVLSD
jgi:hypothetical protein